MAMGLVFLLFASPYTTPLNPYYGYDSAVFMVLGKGVAAGKLPYLDLYDNKGPMIFYINALGYLLGGPDGGFLPPGGVYGPVPGAAVPAGPAVHGYPPGLAGAGGVRFCVLRQRGGGEHDGGVVRAVHRAAAVPWACAFSAPEFRRGNTPWGTACCTGFASASSSYSG